MAVHCVGYQLQVYFSQEQIHWDLETDGCSIFISNQQRKYQMFHFKESADARDTACYTFFFLPRDKSSSSSRENAAQGELWLEDGWSAGPHSRSAGIDAEDVWSCCCGTELLWTSGPTRSIRISVWFVQPVPDRGTGRKHMAVHHQFLHRRTRNNTITHILLI